jgi:probable HAF family extracellular repeat protein
MTTRIRTVAVLMAVLALVVGRMPATAQTLYSITDLGALPDALSCYPSAINDQVTVVGTCTTQGSFSEEAFVWQAGAMTALGKLPRANFGAAHAINALGVIVGESDTGDFRPQATLYRDGTVVDLGVGGGNARAIAVNDSGVIVGNYSKGFGKSGGWSAMIWTERPDRPGRFDAIRLEPYPGGDPDARDGYAVGANQQLQVVGWVQNSLFGQMGAFWDNDAAHTLALLAPPPGHWTSMALAVNDFGQAVGQSNSTSGTRAVLWMNDAAHTPVDFGVLAGDATSTATGINNQGQVIGLSISADGATRPFIWQDGSMVEVSSLLDGDPGNAGWVVEHVTAINNLGHMVGTGLYGGEPRMFLMTPVAPSASPANNPVDGVVAPPELPVAPELPAAPDVPVLPADVPAVPDLATPALPAPPDLQAPADVPAVPVLPVLLDLAPLPEPTAQPNLAAPAAVPAAPELPAQPDLAAPAGLPAA